MEEEQDFELIEGEKIIIKSQSIIHQVIRSRLACVFANYIDKNNIEAIVICSKVDVKLSEYDHFMPDLIVILDLKTVANGKFVDGTPDLVVEVLSESTMKNDLGKKKDAYEKYGVKEYWIIDQWSKRIDIYHLIDGKFKFNNIYKLSDEGNNDDKIKVSIFDDLMVDVRSVFKWYFD